MRCNCTASRQINLRESQLTIGNSLSGKYPTIRRASSNVYFSLLCQCSIYTANLTIICELIIRNPEVLVDIPIRIWFTVECVIYHIIRISCDILGIMSFVFTIMGPIVIFKIVVVFFHNFSFLIQHKDNACERIVCSLNAIYFSHQFNSIFHCIYYWLRK